MTVDKTKRKELPIASGMLDYFPDAITEVAHTSFVGNQQHNPGEPLHWARGKSGDHADCIVRHLIDRGKMDTDGIRHSAKVAWRALAMLQLEIEADAMCVDKSGAYQEGPSCVADIPPVAAWKLPVAATETEAAESTARQTTERINRVLSGTPADPVGECSERTEEIYLRLISLGCPQQVARQIVCGITFNPRTDVPAQWVYIAGPMRGYEDFNFPAFDYARDDMLDKGYHVISPADIDRADGFKREEFDPYTLENQKAFVLRDFWSLFFLASKPGSKLKLLPGWTRSVGASAEIFLARWLGIELEDVSGGRPVGSFGFYLD